MVSGYYSIDFLTWGSPAASHSRIAFLPFSTTFMEGFFKMVGNPGGKFLSEKEQKNISTVRIQIMDILLYLSGLNMMAPILNNKQ